MPQIPFIDLGPVDVMSGAGPLHDFKEFIRPYS